MPHYSKKQNSQRNLPATANTPQAVNRSLTERLPLITEWEERYGSDSDWFRFRVKGEAPRVGFSAFIPPDAVDACRKYKAVGFESLPKIMAVDVARFGDDRSVIGLRPQ